MIVHIQSGTQTMLKFVRKLFKNRAGATAIEYGLIAALVSVAAVVALGQVGTSLQTMFSSVATTLTAAVPATP